jgi:hypothetical protein
VHHTDATVGAGRPTGLIVNIVADPCDLAKSATLRRCRTPGVFAALDGAEPVLIAGAGGGFDVYAGLPLAFSLILDGERVQLANLSFAELHLLDLSAWRSAGLAEVTDATVGLPD